MSKGFRLWIQGPMTRVFPDDLPPETREGVFELCAARGEVECCQVGVRVDDVDPSRIHAGNPNHIRATVSDLTGLHGAAIAAGQVDILYPEFVPVKWAATHQFPGDMERIPPAFFPDPLAPDVVFDVCGPRMPPTRSIWVRIRVPREAAAGIYDAVITVFVGRQKFNAENQPESIGFEKSAAIRFRLRVWDFDMPERSRLLMTNWFWPAELASWYKVRAGTPAYWHLIELAADDMAAHRQNVILTPLFGGGENEDVNPQLVGIRRRGRKYAFDFRQLDRWFNMFLKRGFVLFEGQHLAGASRKPVAIQVVSPSGRKQVVDFGDARDPKYEEFFAQFFAALWSHLGKRGWRDHFVQHVSDEPNLSQLKRFRRLANLVRRAAPGMRFMDALSDPEFADVTDIPVPLESSYDRVLAKSKRTAEDIWVYYCCGPCGRWPNRFIEYPLIRVRIFAWICFQKRIPGFLHWGYNYWSAIRKKVHNPWDDPSTHRHPAGDPCVIYPPRDERMPRDRIYGSIRWEIIRKAMEDHEYLCMTRELAESGNAEARDILDEVATKVVLDWTTYTRDWTYLDSVRARMGALLSKTTSD